MRRLGSSALLAGLIAAQLGAQSTTGFEVGAFGQFTKYHEVTQLDNGFGTGARLTGYFLKRLGLEYEGDLSSTQSARVGHLQALNHRVDMMLYIPVWRRLSFLGGGGWTGTQYSTDTTKNQYDSGGNAVAGFKYCIGSGWTWRADVNVDFKDPSDQTIAGDRTRTWNMRFGFGRLLGNGSNSPCYVPPPPPPPPRMAPPERQPEPQPVVQAPVPKPEPEPVKPTPTPEPPKPTPVYEPPPKPRELMSLRNAYFAFNKFELTAHGQDTLGVVVQFMQSHPEAKIEVQGHTDDRGTEAYNQGLSERRANAVKSFLVSQGIAESRITTRGLGESQPVADNKTEAGRAKNRRVVVLETP
jgi:OOP family OmpA-OmpF porin